jgi:outer membrane receptor protein involved in Fe transport
MAKGIFLAASVTLALLLAVATSGIAAEAQGAPSKRVAGVVKDTLGRPVEGVSIALQNANGKVVAKGTSGPGGEFELQAPPTGVYAIIVTRTGFKPATRIVTLPKDAAKPVDVALESEARLSLPVSASRLPRGRNAISPVTGGSAYTFDEKALTELPEGQNTPLNQVLLQAPGVVQDSFGQLHVRGDHANLQYRINGVQLPEGITGFGQVLTPRFAHSVTLLTGVLPAQFGLRTAGVIDIKTKDGSFDDVADVELYGGQRGTIQPSFEYGGSKGGFSYFMTGQFLHTDRGVEPPTPGPTAIHDTSNQGSGFGFFSYFLNPTTRLSLITGTSVNHFQIPNNPGQPQVFKLAGVPFFPSSNLDETQFEQNHFAILTLQGLIGPDFEYQVSPFSRYSTVSFNPDPRGDLIFNGASSKIFRSDWGQGLQVDTTYKGVSNHTLGVGGYFDHERAEIDNHEATFPAAGGVQTSPFPVSLVDNIALTSWSYSGYVQDEWRPFEKLKINLGVRFDLYDGLVRADQASPRVALEYTPFKGTTLHAAYARYFTPPPTELVTASAIQKFAGTTGAAASNGNGNPTVERDHYFDAGVSQRLLPGLDVGIDSYYKKARDLIDEGQFGPALIFQTFNYAKGRVYGVEFTSSYTYESLYSYANFAYSVAQGTQVESGQFNFAKDELQFIKNHYVFLDHDQTFSASYGAAYGWHGFTFSVDGIYGSGLRSGFANTGNLPYYIQVNAGITKRIELAQAGAVVVRGAVVNLNDRTYLIRNGTGIGVSAAQYGPRRAFYGGIKWELPFTRPAHQ